MVVTSVGVTILQNEKRMVPKAELEVQRSWSAVDRTASIVKGFLEQAPAPTSKLLVLTPPNLPEVGVPLTLVT